MDVSSFSTSTLLTQSSLAPSNSNPVKVIRDEAIKTFLARYTNADYAIEMINFLYKEFQLQYATNADTKLLTLTLTKWPTDKSLAPIVDFFQRRLQINLTISNAANEWQKVTVSTKANSPYLQNQTAKAPLGKSQLELSSLDLFEEPSTFDLDTCLGIFWSQRTVTDSSSDIERITCLIREIYNKLQTQVSLEHASGHKNIRASLLLDFQSKDMYTIKSFFSNQFKMLAEHEKCTTSYCDITMSTAIDNPLVKPKNSKPILECSFLSASTVMANTQYFNDTSFADITFLVEGEKVLGHKLILAKNCPYFATMLNGQWQEKNKDNPSVFNSCTYTAFLELKQFIYLGKLSDGHLDKIDNCIELFKLAHHIHFEPLLNFVKEALSNHMNEYTFLETASLAVQYGDKYLMDLCRWFAIENPSFGEELDLSEFAADELILLKQNVINNCELPNLKSSVLAAFKRSVKLDNSFIKTCNSIYATKDSDLKVILLKSLKKNPQMMEDLRQGSKEKYKDHWKAFKQLATAVEI